MCGLVTIHADVADLCSRDKAHNAVNHAKTASEHGNESYLNARKHACLCDAERSLDIHLLCRKISQCLIAHKHGSLGNQLSELLGACIDISHK